MPPPRNRPALARSAAWGVATLLLGPWLVARGAWGQPRGDAQLRAEVEVTVPVRGRLAATVGADARAARVADNSRARGEGALLFPLAVGPHVTLTPRYRYLAADEFGGPSQREHRLAAEGIVRGALGPVSLADYTVSEWRFREGSREFRVRNRFRVEHPLRGRRETTLFASNELYLERRLTYTRNRLVVGVERDVGGGASVELYYMKQDDWRERPEDYHILGVELEVDVRPSGRR